MIFNHDAFSLYFCGVCEECIAEIWCREAPECFCNDCIDSHDERSGPGCFICGHSISRDQRGAFSEMRGWRHFDPSDCGSMSR